MNRKKFSKYLQWAFRLRRQSVEELSEQKVKSIARVEAAIQERLTSGDLAEERGIDCQMIRPFLAQIADPLELAEPPDWMEEHLDSCESCPKELEGLEELCHIIAVAEMPTLLEEVIDDAPADFMEKVNRLRAIQPEQITCEQTETYFHQMATCNLETPAPAEFYRHVRNCSHCKEQVRDLRSELGVGIPQVGSAEFGALLHKSSQPRIQGVGFVATLIQHNWRKIAVAGIAAVLVIGFLIISPGRALAVTFEQVCEAFAKMQYIHRHSPLGDTWYSRKPMLDINIQIDGTYSRFSEVDGTLVEYNSKGRRTYIKRYSQEELADEIERLKQSWDLRKNMGLDTLYKPEGWVVIEKNMPVRGKMTNVYSFSVEKDEPQARRTFHVFVDESTALPARIEMYMPYWETQEPELITVIDISYPDRLPGEVLNPPSQDK